MRSFVDTKTLLLPLFIALLLIVVSQYNFLLFHTLAELFAIVVAVLVAVVAWLMYSYTRNNFLMYLGCGYFWVAALDMMHMLSYKGVSIFVLEGANLSTQFWVGTRYIEAFLLLSAPLFLSRSLNRGAVFLFYCVLAMLLVIAVFGGYFPDGFIDGVGLTTFKVVSEYTIIIMLACAIVFLNKKRKLFDQRIFPLIVSSIVLTMLAELAFTFYVSVYGLSNIAGHIFKFFSFWLIFVAVVKTPLKEPFSAVSKASTYYDAVPDAAIILDKSGTIQQVNRAACQLVGKSVVELVGCHVHEVFHGNIENHIDCPICQSIQDQNEVSGYEMQVDNAIWFDFTTSVISGEESYIEVIRDVTHKKNTILALEKSEERLDITLNSIGDAFITTDDEGNITRMNAVAEQLTGWKFSEAKNISLEKVFIVVDAQTRSRIDSPLKQVLSTGEVLHLSNQTTLLAKDGAEYQIADSVAPIRDADGNIQGLVLIFNDVTEEYRLRETISKNKRDLQAIMDNSPAVIYVKDVEGRYLFLNRSFESIFSLKRNQMIGKTDHDLFQKEVADKFVANDQAVLAAGHALESEETAVFGDEIRRYISIKFPMLDDSGEIYAVCGISTDITDRKAMEDALYESKANLIRGQKIAKLGNWKFTPSTGEIEGSDELLSIFELSADEVTLDAFISVIHPEDKDYALKPFYDSIDIGEGWEIEYRLLLKNGLIKWIHVVGEPVMDDQHNVGVVIGIVQDITARKQADEVLRRTQKMDALGKLTGGIAHDFNNLLGVVLGYAELLSNTLNNEPELVKYTDEIRHAGMRGAKLTRKLLAFSRHKTSDETVVDVNHLLLDAQDMLEKTLTARIVLSLTLADDVWPVMLDSGDLEDAIINVSINAMHAMPMGGSLTIETSSELIDVNKACELQLIAGDYVLCRITDTGCGMDSETKEKLFDPFYTTKGDMGTGLGLSQVYGFVERSGGAINVESELGVGTVIELYFPRHLGEVSVKPNADSKSVKECDGGKEVILIVDDEPALLTITAKVLEHHGYQVLTAENAEQALALLESNPVELLFSDVVMPGLDGYQLAKVVKGKYPNVKVQLTSGFSNEHHLNSDDEMLHKNILNKPYEFDVLLTQIRNVLDGHVSSKIEGKTILIMDDEADIRDLFSLNLQKLGCNAVTANTGEEAISCYQQALNNNAPIGAVIMDLSIPGSIKTADVVSKIRSLEPEAKLIVASGHSESLEMTRYEEYGFDGALEKDFNRAEMKRVLEQVFNAH